MANTGRISGKDLYVTLGGVAIHGDFTSLSIADEEDIVDVVAGADTYHYYLALRRDGTVDFECFYDGAATTIWDGILPGTAGTLIVAPKGTDSGNPKWTWDRVVVQSRNVSIPFDDGVKVTARFQMSALLSEATY